MMTKDKLNKVAIITSTDLDGIFSYELIREYLGVDNIILKEDYSPVAVRTMDLIKEVLLEDKNIKVIFLVDKKISIAVTKRLLKDYPELTLVHLENNSKVDTNRMEGLENVIYEYSDINNAVSSSELVVRVLENKFREFKSDNITDDDWEKTKEVLKYVSLWDNCSWGDKGSEIITKLLQMTAIEKLYDGKTCFNMMRQSHPEHKLQFSDKFDVNSKQCYNDFQFAICSLTDKIKKSMTIVHKDNMKIGIVYNLDYKYYSLVANRLFKVNYVDIIMNIMPSGLIGARGSSKNNVIDLSEFSSKLPGGGGGHFNSAGGKLYPESIYIDDKEGNKKELLIEDLKKVIENYI